MNLRILAIVAAVALATSAITVTNFAQHVTGEQDKCRTDQQKDRSGTSIFCSPDSDLVKDVKKECKETIDNKEERCSGSQTGNGELK